MQWSIDEARNFVFYREWASRLSWATSILIACLTSQFPTLNVYRTVHHLDSWIKIDQLDVTCFIFSLFNAQHVSNVSTSILRSLRLICWVISCVVLLWYNLCWCYGVVWLGWCGIRMQAEACTTPSAPYTRPTQRLSRPPPKQKTRCRKPYAATQHLMLLMIGVCTRNMSS